MNTIIRLILSILEIFLSTYFIQIGWGYTGLVCSFLGGMLLCTVMDDIVENNYD
jgi:hypothetical protein